MGFVIDSGEGNAVSAGVTPDYRLKTNAVIQTTEHYANQVVEQAYNIIFTATPTAAGDCFFYLKNTSNTDLILEGINLQLAANEYIDMKLKDMGTPAGGSDVVPANLNTGSGNLAAGVFKQGSDITGLSGGTTVIRLYHASSLATVNYNFNQDLIISKNGVFTLYVETGTTALSGFLEFHYIPGV